MAETETKNLTGTIPVDEALRMFERVSTPPQEALKPIDAGKLAGKSEINPMWRYKMMVSLFGVYGEGWKVEYGEVQKIPYEKTGEVLLIVEANIYTRAKDGNWNAPSTAYGTSYLIIKDKYGLHVNENAHASAQTDAFGKACKPYGIGYDVYMGKFERKNNNNGNGNFRQPYNNQPARPNNYQQKQTPVTQAQRPAQSAPAKPATQSAPEQPSTLHTPVAMDERKKMLMEMRKQMAAENITSEAVSEIIAFHFKKRKSTDLTDEELKTLKENLMTYYKSHQERMAKSGK